MCSTHFPIYTQSSISETLFVPSGSLGRPLTAWPFLCTPGARQNYTGQPPGTRHPGPRSISLAESATHCLWPLLWDGQAGRTPRASNLSSLLLQGQQGHLDHISWETEPPSHTPTGNAADSVPRRKPPEPPGSGHLNQGLAGLQLMGP